MFKLIKDPEVESYYVVTRLYNWANEGDYFIIGSGKTEKDALMHTLERVFEKNRKNEELLDNISDLIGKNNPNYNLESFDVAQPRDIDPEDIQDVLKMSEEFKKMGREYGLESDTRTSTKFSQMYYDKENDIWQRLYC